MIKTFILIFYLSGYNEGGPATAEFQSLDKCEDAIVQLREKWDRSFRGGICIEK